eukprot:gene8767-18135_t
MIVKLLLLTVHLAIGVVAKPSIQHHRRILSLNAGFSNSINTHDEDRIPLDISPSAALVDEISIVGFAGSCENLNGIYVRHSDNINDRPHFVSKPKIGSDSSYIHLYWNNNQWILHYDLNMYQSDTTSLAYADSSAFDPRSTSLLWFSQEGNTFVVTPHVQLTTLPATVITPIPQHQISATEEIMGIPKRLWPIYAAFMLDAIAVGLVMPLLPFYVMQLNCNALQLSMVISANYVAQMLGCVVMGRVSDTYGRRIVALFCLSASTLSYFCVSHAKSLVGVAIARVIAGSCGGLIPVLQASVADIIPLSERPKYLGRIQAIFGLGFVIGPMISALLPGLSTKYKIRLGALLPFLGFLLTFTCLQETHHRHRNPTTSTGTSTNIHTATATGTENSITPSIPIPSLSSITESAGPGPGPGGEINNEIQSNTGRNTNSNTNSITNSITSSNIIKESKPLPLSVLALVFNGFLLMYAFGTETIYAMFIKDIFGYGERALSTIFAINGLLIGLFQVFLIKYIILHFGKHNTLAIGNGMLSIGMLGIGLCRDKVVHFLAFTIHILGYSIADTGVVSLISRYANQASQGRALALNQAAQACARVFSPLIA